MTEENLPPTKDPIGTRLLSGFFNLVRIIVRFVIVALLIALLALLVFGIPFGYWRFVIPTLNEFEHLTTAQVEQQHVNQSLLNEQQDIQQRLDTLETRLDTEKQQVGEISQALEGLALTQQDNQEQTIQTQDAAYEMVQKILTETTTLGNKLFELTAALEFLEKRVDDVEDNTRELEVRLLSEDEPINQLRRDIQVLRVLEFLTRSRLYIFQSNFGLAQDELTAAKVILSNIDIPEDQSESATEVIDRIDAALENLPDSPDLAAGELEIVWQILNSRLFNSTTVDLAATSSPALSTISVTATPPGVGTTTATPTR